MARILDPKIAELVDAAFEKSWPFVKTDPELAHDDPQEMRTRLADRLTRLAQNGERDMWRLANAAIGQLRRERSGLSAIPKPLSSSRHARA